MRDDRGLRASLVRMLRMLAAVVAAIVLVPAGSPGAPKPKAPAVANNVQVNQVFPGPFPTNKQNEPSLAQNPTNPLNLIAGSNDEIKEPACTNTTPSSCPFVNGVQTSGFYASFDGGKTWPCQGVIDLSALGEYSFGDPWQVFDSRGNAYYGQLAFPIATQASEAQENAARGSVPADFFVAKSTDGGCSYSQSVKVSGASPAIFDDKDSITADAGPTSPFRDNVYAAWTKFTPSNADQILFARSTDGGRTFSNPAPISPGYNNVVTGGRQGANVKTGTDGTVFVVWLDTVDRQAVQRMSISRDGGQTFPGQNILVAQVNDDGFGTTGAPPVPGASFRQDGRPFPQMTIAPDGTLYVVWAEHHGGAGGHGVVMVTKSTTSGATWSTPAVAGNVPGRSAFFASIAADPSGTVNVAFVALDDAPAGTAPGAGVVHYDAYLTQSMNGGATFTSPLKISTATSDPDGSSTNSLGAQFLGDYITAVADSGGGKVFVVWTDSRNATPCAAVDAFRARTASKPDVITQCPTTFGNTDIFLGTVSY